MRWKFLVWNNAIDFFIIGRIQNQSLAQTSWKWNLWTPHASKQLKIKISWFYTNDISVYSSDPKFTHLPTEATQIVRVIRPTQFQPWYVKYDIICGLITCVANYSISPFAFMVSAFAIIVLGQRLSTRQYTRASPSVHAWAADHD